MPLAVNSRSIDGRIRCPMGLDVYVGTFTRYYQRDWLTIVQQTFPGQVILLRQDEEEHASAEGIENAVAAWSQRLAQALKLSSLGSEDAEMPYFTDKPAWDGYGGLLLWAAYEDQGVAPKTRRVPVEIENWSDDPVWKRASASTSKTRYPQLLRGAEVWLPIPAPSLFKSIDVAGNERIFGNCKQLLGELDLLNSRTWGASPAQSEGWSHDGLGQRMPLEAAARFGWSIMHRLATKAVMHNLPIILDY